VAVGIVMRNDLKCHCDEVIVYLGYCEHLARNFADLSLLGRGTYTIK
jgi:hypothetical protein